MHSVVGVKKGFIWEQAKIRVSIKQKVLNISRGKAEAKSREHEHGSKPSNPMNIKHKELKLKGEGLVNQRKLINKEQTDQGRNQ